MLPARHRMRRSTDFSAAVRSGRRAGRRCLVVHYLETPDELITENSVAVIGFVVSKAVGGSVVRHQVARRLRAAVRECLSDFPVGSRVVIRANPNAAHASVDELRGDIQSGLRRVSGGQ